MFTLLRIEIYLLANYPSQINSDGVGHQFITSEKTKRNGAKEDLSSNVYLCSIQSLVRKLDKIESNSVFIIDEAHHAIKKNQYGKLEGLGLIIGSTATPKRLDGEVLIGEGGMFSQLIQAESMKKESVKRLIAKGFLSDFDYYSVPCLINESELKRGASDYTKKSLNASFEKNASLVFSDAIKNYKLRALNSSAMIFCVSIRVSEQTAREFRFAGISAAAIHSKLSDSERDRILSMYKSGLIKVLCNVDIIGEGIDIPFVKTLIILRKTASLSLFRQWCGRVLRRHESKDRADNNRSYGMLF